jgi:hypothetical protein
MLYQKSGLYCPIATFFDSFYVELKNTTVSNRGRIIRDHTETIKPPDFTGVIGIANQKEVVKYLSLQHPISHTIVHDGSPLANIGDTLIQASNNYRYYIQSIETARNNWKTVYYCLRQEFEVSHNE